MANTQTKFDDDELLLLLDALQIQRREAEDEKKNLKLFIAFCKQTEAKLEELIQETE